MTTPKHAAEPKAPRHAADPQPPKHAAEPKDESNGVDHRGATGSPPTPVSRHSPWLVLFALCLGFFMIMLDLTIVNIAVPDMINDLSASLDQILWVTNAYILMYAVLLITAGRIGDLVGPKRLYLGGLLLFTLASAACGLAQDPNQLIAARVAQGIGGALLTPQTLSVITMIFPGPKRGAAFGVWGAVAGVATVAGPTLGGFIVTNWGWTWIFYVNVPIGIAALLFAAIVMPNLRLNRRHRLDPLGTALVTVGLVLVTYGLIEGQPHDWGRVWGLITIPQVIGAGAVVLVIFLVQQYVQRNGEPLVPFPVLRDRNFAVMNLVMATLGFAMVGLFLPLVIYLQSVLGLSALSAGLAVAPLSVVSMVVSPVAGRLADRFGGKYILMIGLSAFAVGMWLVLTAAQPDSGRWDVLPGLLVAGFGMGMTFAPAQTVAMRDVQPEMAGAASGLINTTRQIGSVIGAAAVGAVLQNQLAVRLADAAERNSSALPTPFRRQFVDGFDAATGDNLQIGAGQSGVGVPPGVPRQVQDVFLRTFHEGFTDAMRVSLVVPIVVVAVTAVVCLAAKRPTAPAPAVPPESGDPDPARPDGRDPARPDGHEPAQHGGRPAERQPADAVA
jgi:EmrB/QacA subfamily drug resistance transporter